MTQPQQHPPTPWRSLDEFANTPAFQSWLKREFPQGAPLLANPVSRRAFLQLAAASLGLAGLAACTPRPAQRIVPYVTQPELLTPGEPLTFATAVPHAGFARGVLAESRQGRPVKLEGNPAHPATRGSSDPFTQAALLGLYDPDRAQTVQHNGRIRTWADFLHMLNGALPPDGDGLRILSGAVTSPTLQAQRAALLAAMPSARWVEYEPIDDTNARQGAVLAFGMPRVPRYDFSRADVILSLGSDFLQVPPGHLAYARAFGARRTVRAGRAEMNRLYAVESTPTLTGAQADHRWPLPPHQVEAAARAVARALGVRVPAGAGLPPALAQALPALVRDLQAAGRRALVVAGLDQPPAVHALAAACNAALGSIGETVVYAAPLTAADPAALRALVAEMRAGAVQTLLILGSNPAYTAPADLDFAAALDHVPLRIALSLYADETAVRCDWLLPLAHPLEAWGDARAYDGAASLIQPLIEPLYAGRTSHELIAAVAGRSGSSAHDLVRAHWQTAYAGADFEAFWRQALQAGVVPGTETAVSETTVTPQPLDLPAPAAPAPGLTLLFRPDPGVWDGRYANNAWLQELPRPFSKLTWGNAALLSPATAARLGVANEDVVQLALDGRTLDAPVWVLPGQADDCVTLHLGYGRTHAGRAGSGRGANAYALRTSAAPWQAAGLQLSKGAGSWPLATTQNHYLMEGRDLVRAGTLAQFRDDPGFVHAGEPPDQPSLYPDVFTSDGYAWGMSIDLTACIGCNACTIACQAENNIPVVGPEEVRRGREMHWIRVDGYFAGDPANPAFYHEPVPCMHCEKAPCEPVCPVAATTHSTEGLNEMTYNRCVGTRYCANNCPYKVRRFNFLDYTTTDEPVLNLAANPEVTIRPRGVMEKCTYCVQRINRARIAAKRDGRFLQDGDVVTACQQACPTQAIRFGDLNDPDSAVSRLKAEPHDFSLLHELGTRPRTTYLPALRNPNPEVVA